MATLAEKNTYNIDYGTGAGTFEFTGTLEEAMEEANKGLCYTQVPVSISIKDGCDENANLTRYGLEE